MTKHRKRRSRKDYWPPNIPHHIRIFIEILAIILVLRHAHIQVNDVLPLFKLFQ